MGNSSTDRGKEILEFITSPEYKEKPIYLPKYDIYFVPQDEAEKRMKSMMVTNTTKKKEITIIEMVIS